MSTDDGIELGDGGPAALLPALDPRTGSEQALACLQFGSTRRDDIEAIYARAGVELGH